MLKASLRAIVTSVTCALGLVLATLLRRRLQQRQPSSACEAPPPRPAPAVSDKTPRDARTVTIVTDGSDASVAVGELLCKELGPSAAAQLTTGAKSATLTAAAATCAACYIFVVEVDKEGELVERSLARVTKGLQAEALQGLSVAVMALARSVCAFSAASGGADKFRGGSKLLASLKAAGACAVLAKCGMAEVEVEEVEVSVVPWAGKLREALAQMSPL